MRIKTQDLENMDAAVELEQQREEWLQKNAKPPTLPFGQSNKQKESDS